MEQTARILFDKFLNGTCTKDELDRLMEILRENDHEAEFRSMLEKVYNDINLGQTQETVAETADQLDNKVVQMKRLHSPNRSWSKYLLGAAACLLFGLGVVYFWNMNTDSEKTESEIMTAFNAQLHSLPKGKYKNQQTRRAEQKYMLLPDGTQVWLNAESSLIVPDKFDSNKRIVYLKGEAFFDVKHADKIPFIIHMPNKVTTTVLGTAFDIKAYGDREFSVTVKRGKVLVRKDQKSLGTLTVGQQIKMSGNQHIQPVIQEVKKENIASWTEGKLSYDALELSDILKDLERVYDVSIELNNKELSKEVITTAFNRGEGISEILRTLCLLTGSRFKTEQDNIYIIE